MMMMMMMLFSSEFGLLHVYIFTFVYCLLYGKTNMDEHW